MIGLGQGFRGSRFHPRLRTAFGMRICEKSVRFVRPLPKFGAKLQLLEKMSIFNEDFGSSIPALSLTLNPAFSGKPLSKIPLGGEPVNGY